MECLETRIAPATFATGVTFATGSNPITLAEGDLNGDGRPDLAIANAGADTVSVLLNITAPGATIPSYTPQQTFAVGDFPISVAIGDLNGDGLPDLVVANVGSDTVSVLRNQTSPGSTTPNFAAQVPLAAADGPDDVVIADINGDGRPDIAVAQRYSDSVGLLLNTTTAGGSPSFGAQTTFAAGDRPESIAAADFNGDGRLDVAVANLSSNNVSVFLNQTVPGGSTGFAAPMNISATGAFSVAAGDLNADGRPDLAVVNLGSNTASVFLNQSAAGAGSPSFVAGGTFSAGSSAAAVSIGDVNGDARPDLIVTNAGVGGAGSISFLKNQTSPGATTANFAAQVAFPAGANARAGVIGDVNGDGRPDVATVNYTSGNTVTVLLNTTDVSGETPDFLSQSTFATTSRPHDVVSADLNGDGKPDLINTNGYSNTLQVRLNTTITGFSTAAFSGPASFATQLFPIAAAVGDFNGDGRPDIVAANRDSNNVSVLLNNTAAGATTPAFADQLGFAAGTRPGFVTVADVNGDGRPDLVVANYDSNNVSVLLNTTSLGASVPNFASAVNFSTGTNPVGVVLGDLNGDGRPDLVTANFISDNISVRLNTTTPGAAFPSFGTEFTFAAGDGAYGLALGDLNGDGRPDLAVANINTNTVSILLNRTAPGSTTASFAPQSTVTVGANPSTVALGDLDGDGLLDLSVSNRGSNTVSILRNTTGSATATLHTIDWDPDGSFNGLSAGTLGPYRVTLTSTDGPANGGSTAAAFLATSLATNGVSGINDSTVSNEVVALDWNPGAAGTVTVSFGGGAVQNPILFFQFTDTQIETFDFDDGLTLTLLDQNPPGSVTIAPGNVVTTSGGNGNTFNDGFAVQLTGSFTSFTFATNVNLDTTVNSVGFSVGTRSSNFAATFAAQETVPTGTDPRNVVVADFNNDFFLDLAVGNTGANNNIGVLLSKSSAPAATAYAVSGAGNLIRFDAATPDTILSSVPITGLRTGETLIGIDFRPATGQLFGLGSTGRLYLIDHAGATSALATQVGTGSFDPALLGTTFGFDFNPVVDRIRVTSNSDQNLRLNPNDGTVVDFNSVVAGVQTDQDLNYAVGDVNAGANPNVTGSAYTNSVNYASSTTLYGIDTGLDILVTQNPPNNGTLNTVGGLGVDATDVLGFDIRDSGGTPVGYATLLVNGTSQLYTIDLLTGEATFAGVIGDGSALTAFAIAPTAFTASVSGSFATFTGSAAADSISFDQSGGLLRHNRFSAGDLGFASDFDFDSTVPGDQTVSISPTPFSVIINGGQSDDHVTVGSAISPAGELPLIAFLFNGEGGGDTFTIEDSASVADRSVQVSTTTISGICSNLVQTGVERLNVNMGAGNDTIVVSSTPNAMVSISTGAGDDLVKFSNAQSLRGGLLDGGMGSNTLDYTSWTTAVNVDLSTTNTLFLATLSGAQEPGPLSSSQGSGLGIFTLNAAQTELAFNITASGVTGATVTGNHFHNAATGMNGTIVRGLTAGEQVDNTSPNVAFLGGWSSNDAAGIGGVGSSGPLTPALVDELFANRIYFNTHTNLFPSGELRGQLINMGAVGLATGTGGVRNFSNASGGSANDTFVASSDGGQLIGGGGDDTLRLSPLTGTTVVLGGSGVDTIDFSLSTVPITFDLDLVGASQLVASSDGRVLSADLFENFIGSAFSDLIKVDGQSSPRSINGGAPSLIFGGDRLVVDARSQAATVLKSDFNSGVISFTSYNPIAYDDVETVEVFNSAVSGGFLGGGTDFAPPTRYAVSKLPKAVAVGDVNGDGIADLITANSGANTVSVLLGLGDGTFTSATNFASGGKSPSDLALGDAEGDGDIDLFVVNRLSHQVAVFLNPGDGSFSAPSGTLATARLPQFIAVGDVNGDGRADIITGSTAGNKLSIIHSDGLGGYIDAKILASGGKGLAEVVTGDFDRDGHLDLVALHKGTKNLTFFTGNPTGDFTLVIPERIAVGANPTALAVADFNNDGALDLAVNRASKRLVAVLLGRGASDGAQFLPVLSIVTPKTSNAVAFGVGDLNGDGIPDLALTSPSGDLLRVLPSGLFGSAVDFALGNKPRRVPTALAIADFNGDLVPDIVLTHRTGEISVILRTPV